MLSLTALLFLVTVGTESEGYRPDGVIYRYLRAEREIPVLGMCGLMGEQCVPGQFRCCGDLQCKNKFGSLCLYPLEACYCWMKPGNKQLKD